MQKLRSLLVLYISSVVFALTLSACSPLGAAFKQLIQTSKPSTQLIVELQTTPENPEISTEELSAVQKVIENRINALGVYNPVIQKVGTDKILVELRGVEDPKQAERILGTTAKLEFREQKPNTQTQLQILLVVRNELKLKQQQLSKSHSTAAINKNLEDLAKNNQAIAQLFTSTNPPLDGKYLKDAYGEPNTGDDWNVYVRFDQTGGKIFAELTKSLAGTGRSVGIFLDNELISSPVVGAEFAATGITGDSAVITGKFTAEQANNLAVQLRGGALPVPVKITVNTTSKPE